MKIYIPSHVYPYFLSWISLNFVRHAGRIIPRGSDTVVKIILN